MIIGDTALPTSPHETLGYNSIRLVILITHTNCGLKITHQHTHTHTHTHAHIPPPHPHTHTHRDTHPPTDRNVLVFVLSNGPSCQWRQRARTIMLYIKMPASLAHYILQPTSTAEDCMSVLSTYSLYTCSCSTAGNTISQISN